MLYKDAVESQKLAQSLTAEAAATGAKASRSELKKTQCLVQLLQSKVHTLGLTLPPRGKTRKKPGIII